MIFFPCESQSTNRATKKFSLSNAWGGGGKIRSPPRAIPHLLNSGGRRHRVVSSFPMFPFFALREEQYGGK